MPFGILSSTILDLSLQATEKALIIVNVEMQNIDYRHYIRPNDASRVTAKNNLSSKSHVIVLFELYGHNMKQKILVYSGGFSERSGLSVPSPSEISA